MTTPDNLFSEETEATDPAFGAGEGTGSDVILTHVAVGEIDANNGKYGGTTTQRHD
jgi:hypothetical protein